MENERIFTLFLDREVIDGVSYKKKDLLCILSVLLEYYQQQSIRNQPVTKISCTVAGLWLNMVWSVKPSRRDKENFIESLNRLIETDLIRIVDESDKSIRWNSMLIIDVTNLIHDTRRTFVKFETKKLEKMIEINYRTLTVLLQLYISITSYFNVQEIAYFDECIQKGISPIDENYDLYGSIEYHVSCWASQDRLAKTKHSSDKTQERWISKQTLIDMIDLLEELGLIAVIRPHLKSGEKLANHYCYPRHKKYVQQIVDKKVQQLEYSKENPTE